MTSEEIDKLRDAVTKQLIVRVRKRVVILAILELCLATAVRVRTVQAVNYGHYTYTHLVVEKELTNGKHFNSNKPIRCSSVIAPKTKKLARDGGPFVTCFDRTSKRRPFLMLSSAACWACTR